MAPDESIKIIKTTRKYIYIYNLHKLKQLMTKLKKFWKKNVWFDLLQKVSNILIGQNESMDGLPADNSSSDLSFFMFASKSSIDVEHSFSKHKYILIDNRWPYKFPNSRKYLIVQCNAQGN
jgi:hypothetical protein